MGFWLTTIIDEMGWLAMIEHLTENGKLIWKGVKGQRDAGKAVLQRESPVGRSFDRPALQGGGNDAFVSTAELAKMPLKRGGLRVAAYIRVSTDFADQENSYEVQEKYFAALLRDNPKWISAGVYSDCGLSGTNAEGRTGYRRLLRHCKEGKIDRIVCKSISRFARNTSDFLMALDVLRENRVSILFEKENLDTRDPTSSFILTTLAAIAQEESRTISSNIQWSNQKRFPKGHTPNVCLYGYCFAEGDGSKEQLEDDYQIRRLEIVEEEAKIVRYIFREVNEGKKYVDVARKLNARQIPAPREGEKEKQRLGHRGAGRRPECGWTGAIISGLISRERYCGDVHIQKTYTPDFLTHRSVKNEGQRPQYMVYNHHPAIVDRELFASVQAVRKLNANRFRNKTQERNRYAFSGRLTCAHCGRNFHMRNARSNPIWFCPTSALNNGKGACFAEKVYEEQVIRMFRKAFVDRFGLVAEPFRDDVTVEDILSGHYTKNAGPDTFTKDANEFVARVWERLNKVHQNNSAERDRCFLKHQIELQQIKMDEAERQLQGLSSVRMDEQTTEKEKLRQARNQKEMLEQRLSYLEGYWAMLEADYQERVGALQWMKTLPRGREGTIAFLNGLTSGFVRAFALQIIVSDPLHYVIRWFDDTKTEVEMYSNVESYRNTSGYYNRNKQQRKQHKIGC